MKGLLKKINDYLLNHPALDTTLHVIVYVVGTFGLCILASIMFFRI